ncbi:cytokine-dependent hematopoietic cell linker isoform X2 [Choloepus didactylus]|uniref:cytokine-dependent hematopoietic cell linker isoform X2 n=1 Tax=Choloepus didactylus TaxID=27675 RepID=UPI00189CCD90|nr:cytokine-dependent hematopoietic cell linker isoform X2 [Choloepus didactylus]
MAELKIPLICRMPRTMNRQGNRRTTKEGAGDLKFQNFALPKNRSWPRIQSDTGQYQSITESLPDDDGDFTAVLDGAKGHSDEDYAEPELQMAETWQSMKILPARPIKESVYADKRYFKGVMDTPLSTGAKTSISIEGQTWNRWMKPEEVDKPISKDIRSQHMKGDKVIKGNKTPLLPPRPPMALPKKYQPLPPEPENSRSPFSQRHTFPEAHRGPRQMSLKDLSEVLGAEKVPHHEMKPELSHLSQTQNIQESPVAIASSSFMSSNHRVQSRDDKGNLQSCSPQRCQFPISYIPHENNLPYKNVNWRKPLPARSDKKKAQHDWYIREYGRQAVEEALMKENKDGTFLVRDCSKKSRAEPYVLVVFYGNKVYNVKIRFLEGNQQFALGTGLRGDEKFDSVEDIIEHYKNFPIILIDGKDKTGIHREQCYLTQPLSLDRHFSPK